ncbi:hypothetical protein FC84_GL000703 [Lapidilactobacillus dextrinicus DSM 20335]|uniref:DUF3284 domain-containing protein n=1 Tax=Lapidilactobacillus dextrinicus DSM 20335 TaxID=1423738 RepID=A0A0R2BLE6_9LACO|nr:DUF3284 domain-containing protein [Lapidilactobacillus dextrinicus]KRM80000.1 hypothetical protein FC84_GL000703 [Lapidilactobacillus dextrinicus DSM 20335]QFG46227.1 DUF3284 domain-containing protein [Lapidilactobacillus dextrinicus]
MKIQQKLNIPTNFFYRKIVDSVLYDIRTQTGDTISEEQLEGYSYIKQFTKTTSARITITKLVPNEAYYYTTHSNQSDFDVKYEMKSLGNHQTEVIYQENTQSQGGFIRQMNDVLVGSILGFVRRRNFKKMLLQIEQSY